MALMLKNEKGLFANGLRMSIVVENGEEKEWIAKAKDPLNRAKLSKEEAADLARFFGLLSKLKKGSYTSFSFDPQTGKSASAQVPCLGWVSVQNFINEPPPKIGGESMGHKIKVESPEDVEPDWALAQEIVDGRKTFAKALRRIGVHDTSFFGNVLREITGLKKRMGAHSWEDLTPQSKAQDGRSWAIWFAGKDGNEGFVGKADLGRPLSAAALFPSELAAINGAKRRGLVNGFVVSLKMEVNGAKPVTPGAQGGEGLMGALAVAEAKRLEEALEEAGIERLRAKLAELEKRGVVEKDAKPETKKVRI